MDAQQLAKKFQADAEILAEGFIKSYGLKFSRELNHLDSPLFRWLDFVLRYVESKPRRILCSDMFPKRNLPKGAIKGLQHLANLITSGKDINPYQGRGLILKNDTSSQTRDKRTDLLWADWGVLHFHLTAAPIPEGQFFSEPSDYLAFCIVENEAVGFIDVRRHPCKKGFSDPELMTIVHRCWPQYLERSRLKGVSGLSDESARSMEEVHNLRTNGVNSFLKIDGHIYTSPGMGVTSASTSTRVSMAAMRLARLIEELARYVCNPQSGCQKTVLERGVNDPGYSLKLTPQGLVVHEKQSDIGFLLTSSPHSEVVTWLDELVNLIAPKWVVSYLASEKGQVAVSKILG